MLATPRPRRVLPFLALPLVLAACGSDDGGSSTTASTAAQAPPASTTAATPATTAATPPTTTAGGGSSGDVQARIKAISAAMAKVRSFHFEGDQTDDDGAQHLEGDVTNDGRATIDIHVGASAVSVRVIGQSAFFRANSAFWRKQAHGKASVVKQLTGRWVETPLASSGFDDALKQLEPQTLARCITRGTGTLTDGGTTTVDGQQADVLVGKGGQPGTSPGRAYTAATGAPLLLRVTQLGPTKPGGKKDPVCDDPTEKDTTKHSDVHLSRFNEPVTVKVPDDVLKIPGNAGGGSAGTAS